MPTTTGRATDFITFTRTSNATVTDSNGFIEWAGHNLLTNSESFDASAWNKANTTVTANNVVAPNGTTTADRIVEQAVTDRHFVNQNDRISTASDTLFPHTLAVFAKAGERQYLNLSIEWSTNYVAATFDLSGGTVTSNRAGGTGSGNTSTITSVGNDWYLCTMTGILGTAGNNGAVIAIVTTATPTGAKGDTYLGDVTKGLYLWGAHLYRSDLGGMVLNPARGDAYYPTTPRNLLGFTESLTTGWTNTNTTDSIVTETNPNGLASSVEVTATAGNGTLLGSLSLLASPYTFSIWLKRKTGTGTVEITVDGTTYVAAAVTGTWTRFSTTLTPTAGTKTPGIRLVTSGDAVFAWGAQLSDSASLDAYSPVYGAAVTSAAYYAPRLDFDPVTLAAKGLLVEEQRTNLLTYSNELNNAAWAPTSVTVTANALVSPDGTSSAETVAGTASTTSYLASPTATVATSTTYNISIYVKYQSSLLSRIRVFDSGLGTELAGVVFAWSAGVPSTSTTSGTWVTAPTYTSVGNGWYRLSGAFSSGAFTGLKVLFYPDQSALGTSTAVWGAQLEAGSFATSYIPTGAATATRTADVASVSTQAFPYSSSEGTIVVSWQLAQLSGSPAAIHLTDDAENNRIRINAYLVGINRSTITASGSLVANIDTSTAAIGITKYGLAGKTTDYAVYRNGLTGGISTNTGFPAGCTELRIGRDGASGNFNGHIRQITYLPRRISNAELQSRTA